MARNREPRGVSSRWRGLSMLLVGLVGGTLLLAPAGAHIGTPNHLWKKHIKPKVKAFGDKRWINEKQGPMSVSVLGPWVESDPAISSSTPSPALFNFFTGTKTGPVTLELFPELPTSLYGKRVRLTGLELCVDATDASVTLSQVHLTHWISIEPDGAAGNFVVRDETGYDDGVCRSSWAGTGTPQILGTNSMVELELQVLWSGTGTLTIQRTTFFFEPAGAAAGPAAPTGPLQASSEGS